MVGFRRLRCHFCGARSRWSKGMTEFQCLSCEAQNFFDQNGNVVDVPADRIGPQAKRIQTVTTPSRVELTLQQSQQFCDTCIRNQRLYLENLSQYLPDESEPRYAEYEANFPVYKEQLERRYPQICIKCAAGAQRKMHDADLYSQTQAFALNIKNSRERRQLGKPVRGIRDSADKRLMRTVLIGMERLVQGSSLIQILWHMYGILVCLTSDGDSPLDVPDLSILQEPSLRSKLSACFGRCLQFEFSPLCFDVTTYPIGWLLLINASLIWHSPALKYYWHDTYLIESTNGKAQYFKAQLLQLVTRYVAWYTLTDAAGLSDMSVQRRIAVNAVSIVVTIIAQWVSVQGISYQRTSVNTKITPLPEESDIFSGYAGPAKNNQVPQASSLNPLRLLQRDERPFPIVNLATNAGPRREMRFGHPSPPLSPSSSVGQDPMDIDWRQSDIVDGRRGSRDVRSQLTTNGRRIGDDSSNGSNQSTGWSALRDETYRIDDTLRDASKSNNPDTRNAGLFGNTQQPGPFRGKIPQAPMSLGRILRNPPIASQRPQTIHPSSQTTFMSSLRDGIEDARTFKLRQEQQQQQRGIELSNLRGIDVANAEQSPAKLRSFNIESNPQDNALRPAQWTWRKDLDAQWTGLEDMFGGQTFRVSDEPSPQEQKASEDAAAFQLQGTALFMSAVALLAAIITFTPARFGTFTVVEHMVALRKWAFPFIA